MLNKFKGSKKLITGAIISAVFIILAVAGIFYTPYSSTAMNVADKFCKPSIHHVLGCDNYGRDIFSRLIKGLGATMLISLGTNFIGLLVGIIVGSLTGYFGGIVDELLMRFNDALFAFPSILLALVFISIFGPGQYNVMAALGIAFAPSYARIIRGEFMKCRSMDYVKSAKLMGAGNLRIIILHILPNVTPVIFTTVVIGFNNAVLAEAGLSFLGIGVQPPNASLGSMLSDAQAFIFSYPRYAFFTGFTIVLLIIGFALLSDGLEDCINA